MDSFEETNRRLREEEERLKLERQAKQAAAMRAMQEQEQPQGGGGPSPGMVMQGMEMFGGGGGGAAAGEGAAAGSGGGGGGMLAAAGPWAALVAAIAINESEQNKAGNRPDSRSNRLFEGLTGESLTRDVDRLTGDNELAGWVADHGNPKGMGRNMEKSLKPWELFKDWF